MKALPFLFVVLLVACSGSLSDEQRRQMREKMEENKIVRVTEVEITEAAFEEGRRVVAILDSLEADSAGTEVFAAEYSGDIRFLTPGATTARPVEQQLLDAYLTDPSASLDDNVQNIRDENGNVDSLLYTKPRTRKLQDGGNELIGVWNIWLAKKDVVMEISRTKSDD